MAVTEQSAVAVRSFNLAKDYPMKQSESGKIVFFRHDQAGEGEATSTVTLLRLPAGKVNILHSKLFHTAFAATATASIGLGVHDIYNASAVYAEDELLEEVAADPVALVDSADVATDPSYIEFKGVVESVDGVDLYLTTEVAEIPADTVIEGYVIYTVEPIDHKGSRKYSPEP
jgi:hypothetical protein